MKYKVAIAATLEISASQFVSDWNHSEQLRNLARADLIDTTVFSYSYLDPNIIKHGIIHLEGAAQKMTEAQASQQIQAMAQNILDSHHHNQQATVKIIHRGDEVVMFVANVA